MTMTNANSGSRGTAIEARIDRPLANSIGIASGTGMAVGSMGQAMEVAKLMSLSGQAVPPHLRENPGACLAVAIQGWEWGINPFAIANKTYVVNDRMAYESALYQTVLNRRAPIQGRLKCEYVGEGPQRKCRVSAMTIEGEPVEYTSPPTGTIKPKNSPLWQNDPDQQLWYFSVRAFARRHFADVMLGVYTVDEIRDSEPIRIESTVTPSSPRMTARLQEQATKRPIFTTVSEGQTFVPEQSPDAAGFDPQTGEVQDADLVPANDAEPESVFEPEPTPPPKPAPTRRPAAAKANPPGVTKAGYDVGSWPKTLDACNAAAMEIDMTEEAMILAIKAWKLKNGFVGKEEKIPLATRVTLVEAIRNGKLNSDGSIST